MHGFYVCMCVWMCESSFFRHSPRVSFGINRRGDMQRRETSRFPPPSRLTLSSPLPQPAERRGRGGGGGGGRECMSTEKRAKQTMFFNERRRTKRQQGVSCVCEGGERKKNRSGCCPRPSLFPSFPPPPAHTQTKGTPSPDNQLPNYLVHVARETHKNQAATHHPKRHRT